MLDRKEKMKSWLKSHDYDLNSLQVASADASFRQYFRINKQDKSFIVMDAPPENEPCDTFITLANQLTHHGVNAPQHYEQNLKEGFLVLSDFGDDLLLKLLNDDNVDALYKKAMSVIYSMQSLVPSDNLPKYTSTLLNTEMDLFREWFLEKLLGIKLSETDSKEWEVIKNTLIESALEQPQFFVHRDFHSRNLIQTASGELGVIDFQDAVQGPITYDLVSLLRDCYIAWPKEQVIKWCADYYQTASGLMESTEDQFHYWFDLMGTQRHLKAIGIFSRLKLRDGKNGYIADIPRTLAYVKQVCEQEPTLSGLQNLINKYNLLIKADDLVNL